MTRRIRRTLLLSLFLAVILAPMALGGLASSPLGVKPLAGLGSCPLGTVHANFSR